MKEALFPPKRRFLQEPHGVTSQQTPFFMVLYILIVYVPDETRRQKVLEFNHLLISYSNKF
jgi:hypothetical protein